MVQYSGTYATPRLDLGIAFHEFTSEPDEFVATEILPEAPVGRQAASYPNITREQAASSADTKRQAGGGYNRVTMGAEDKTFFCEEQGLEGVADDRHRSLYANDFDFDLEITKQTARKVLLARELRVAALVMNPTTWAGAPLYTDVSAAPWDTAASDVIAHVAAAKEKVRAGGGGRANALILGISQFNNLLVNTKIIARFPGAPKVTEDMLRSAIGAIFGLDKIIVGKATYNSADEGQTATMTDVWGDDYAMVARVCPQGSGLVEPGLGRILRWTPEAPTELVVEQYRDEAKRADVFRCRHDVDEVIHEAVFGHLLKID